MGFVTKFASQQLPSWMPPPVPGLQDVMAPKVPSFFPGAEGLNKKLQSAVPGAEAAAQGDRSLLPGFGLAKGLFTDIGHMVGRND